jgi:Domain of unknown function (DUF1737)
MTKRARVTEYKVLEARNPSDMNALVRDLITNFGYEPFGAPSVTAKGYGILIIQAMVWVEDKD